MHTVGNRLEGRSAVQRADDVVSARVDPRHRMTAANELLCEGLQDAGRVEVAARPMHEQPNRAIRCRGRPYGPLQTAVKQNPVDGFGPDQFHVHEDLVVAIWEDISSQKEFVNFIGSGLWVFRSDWGAVAGRTEASGGALFFCLCRLCPSMTNLRTRFVPKCRPIGHHQQDWHGRNN